MDMYHIRPISSVYCSTSRIDYFLIPSNFPELCECGTGLRRTLVRIHKDGGVDCPKCSSLEAMLWSTSSLSQTVSSTNEVIGVVGET